jgi:hypothetical protein
MDSVRDRSGGGGSGLWIKIYATSPSYPLPVRRALFVESTLCEGVTGSSP